MALKKVTEGQLVTCPSREMAPHGFTRQFHYSPGVVVRTGVGRLRGTPLALVRFHHDYAGSFDPNPTEKWFPLSDLGRWSIQGWQLEIMAMPEDEQRKQTSRGHLYHLSLWAAAEGLSMETIKKHLYKPKARPRV